MPTSFIIPFYDELLFLDQLLASICELGSAVHEIIVVNDAPHLGDTVERFAHKYSKVRIHNNTQNLGASGSRNEGLRLATGEYVYFVDSDDVISPQAFRAALEFAQDTEADITHLPTLVLNKENHNVFRFYRDKALFAQRHSGLTVESLPAIRYAAAGWSFLYRRAFLDEQNLRFDRELRKFEDHLFILNATQKAQRISTFEQWSRVWLRRGGSLSTVRQNLSDFRMQVLSFEKCASFLSQHEDPESIAFQRDLAFTFMRFVTNWSLLFQCIPMPPSSPEHQILQSLSAAVGRNPMDASVFDDAILQKMFGRTVTSLSGAAIPIEQVQEIHNRLCLQDFDAVSALLQINTTKRVSHLSPGKTQHNFSLKAAKANLNSKQLQYRVSALEWSDSAFDFGASISELDRADNITVTVDTPISILWGIYEQRIRSEHVNEMRLFSEFLLDELDSLVAYIAYAKYTFSEFSQTVSIDLVSSFDAPAFLNSFIHAFTSQQKLPSKPANWSLLAHKTSTLPSALVQLATNAANSAQLYLQGKLEPPADPSGSPARFEVLQLFRELETNMFDDLENCIASRMIGIADLGRFGDTDWFGRRTVASRLRKLLRDKHSQAIRPRKA